LYILRNKFVKIITVCFITIAANLIDNSTKSRTLSGNRTTSATASKQLPRFVSLRASLVNLRTGPGVRYPVNWVYESKYLPVEIIAEFEYWRKVRDVQGTQGWIHQSLLSSRRTFIIVNEIRILRKRNQSKSGAVAKLGANVIGELKSCPISSGWCEVLVHGYKGWLRRVDFWGDYANERIK
jgi:SH3-like domain-containing protein